MSSSTTTTALHSPLRNHFDELDAIITRHWDDLDHWHRQVWNMDFYNSHNEIDRQMRDHHKRVLEEHRAMHQKSLRALDETFANSGVSYKPHFTPYPSMPPVNEKYRITVDCSDFSPDAIETGIKGNKVIVKAREDQHRNPDNYIKKELKKTYDLPPEADKDRITSVLMPTGQLVIDMPFRSDINDDVFPRVSEDGQSIVMCVTVPEQVDPAKVVVTCNGRELIIRAEDKIEKQGSVHTYSYCKKTTLPDNTDFGQIKCQLDIHTKRLKVTAPLTNNFKGNTHDIPIQVVKKS